jgi:iron complex outermembrane receptor protein
MHKQFYLLLASIGLSFSTSAQNAIIKGQVTDEQKHYIPYATIGIASIQRSINCNQYGEYQIAVPNGSYTLTASAVGYQRSESAINAADTLKLDFVLNENSRLNEVIVSASRKQETLDEVPSSVTIIGAKSLAVQKIINNNLSDILANSVPGMGFSTNRTSNLGQTMRGRGILVMIDGVPQSTPLRNGARDIRALDPSAIERIEVIKGATSIYGNGADGGLINYITKRADTTKKISGQSSIGTTGMLLNAKETYGYRVSQLFSGTVNKFDYVVSGRYEQTGLYKDANGEVLSPEYGLNDLRMWNAFAKVGYKIDEDNRLELTYNYFRSTQHTDYVARAGVYGDSAFPTTGIPGNRPGKPEGTPYNHNANLHYSNQNIIGKTGLDVNLYWQEFYTLLSLSNFFEGNGQPGIIDKKKGLRINLNSPYTISENLNGSLIYGLDILSDKTATILTDGRVSVPQMDMRNLAPYMQLKTILYNNLIFKAGARFENININVPTYTTLSSRNANTGSYVGGGTVVDGGSLNYNALVFNAGLRYNKTSYFKPFISFSQSFSIGDLGLALRSATQNLLSNITTEAVKANSYEVGFSSTFGKLEVEAATFISTSKLGASYVFVNGTAQIARSPENIHGLELSADYSLTNNLSIGGSYSYSEGKREANGVKIYLGGDRISPAKTTAYVRYNILPDWMIRVQMLNAGNRKRFDAVNGKYSYGTGPIHSFTLFNLFSSYSLNKRSSIQLGIENLFNKDYYTIPSDWMSDNLSYVKGNGQRLNLNYTYTF